MNIIAKISFFVAILQITYSIDYISVPEIEIDNYENYVSLQNTITQTVELHNTFDTQFTKVPQFLLCLIMMDVAIINKSNPNFKIILNNVSQTSFSVSFQKNGDVQISSLNIQYLAINHQDIYVIRGNFQFSINISSSDSQWVYARQTLNYQRNNFDSNVWNVKVHVFIIGFDKTIVQQTNAYTSFQIDVEYSSNGFTIIFKTNDLNNQNTINQIYYNYIEVYQKNNNNYYNIQSFIDNSLNPPISNNPLTIQGYGEKVYTSTLQNIYIDKIDGIFQGFTGFDFSYLSQIRLSLAYPQLNLNQYTYTYKTWFNSTVIWAESKIIVFGKAACNKNSTLFLDDFYQCTSQCPIGYYTTTISDRINGDLNYCKQCDPSCQNCSGTPTQCTSCNPGTFLYANTCITICPNGFLSNQKTWNCDTCTDYRDLNCYRCDKTCFLCNPALTNVCTQCYDTTRYLNSNTCQCNNSNDQRNDFYYCSFKGIAVLNATLSGDAPQLLIDFGSNISLVPNPDTTQSVCQYIFSKQTYDQIGHNSQCSIVGKQVVVNLDNTSSIMEDDDIIFNQNTLKFVDYPDLITQFFRTKVSQSPYGKSQVNFLYNAIQNSCNPLNIQLNYIKNDAGRSFYTLSWSLVSITGSLTNDQLKAINQVIQQANHVNSTSLTINPDLLPSGQNITIQFTYRLKVNYSDYQTFQIYNQKQKIIRISYLQSIYPPIYRYMSLSFYFSFFTEICDFGNVKQFYEPVNVQVVSPNLQQIQQTQMNYNQSNFEVDIPSFTLPSNKTFTFNFQLSLSSDNSIQTVQIVSVDVQITQLLVLLQGGHDQIASYQQQFTLNSTSRDYEIQDSTADQMITYNWICQSLLSPDQICYNYQNNKINLQQGQSSVSIPAKTFSPYTIIKLTLQVSKDTRQSSDFTFCYFSELDIPPLFVITPIEQVQQQFNINEDLLFTLVYNSNVSTNILSYAGALLYDNSVVAAIQFDYYNVKFRIWDYFQNITPTQTNIQVRFSVYNPSYVMPSISTIDLTLNIPPQNCVLTVSPQQGIALQTLFSISFSGCSDVDAPITYQFFYYNSINDYNQEIISPWNIVRRQLNDKSASPSFSTILPQGNLIILSQAIDSRLGVSNSTFSIQVQSQKLSDQNYYQYANQLIQQNMQAQQTNSNLLVNLCIIGEDVSKINQYNGSQQINSLKQNLVTDLQQQSQQLVKSSLASTYANKIIAQLQQSIFQQTDLQKGTVYSQVQQIVQQTQLSISSNSISKFQQNSNLQTQNLIDCFRVLNSTVSLNKNNTYNDFMQYNNISNQIASILSNTMIPNQGELIIQGNLSTILVDSITEKNLYNYVLPDDDTQINLNSTKTYTVTRNTFQQNIYQNTSSFQAYFKPLNNSNFTFNYSKNQLIDTSINITQTQSPISNSTILYSFKNANVNNTYNMTCLQQANVKWSNQNCSILNKGNNNFACLCSKSSPTTLVEDISALFTQNTNLQTAFGEQGLENLENFDKFYLYACFWVLTFFTVAQLIFCIFGKSLDFKTVQKINLNQQFNQQELKEIKYQQDLKQFQEKVQSLEKQIRQEEQQSESKLETDTRNQKNLQSTQKIYLFQNKDDKENLCRDSLFIQHSKNQEDDFNLQQSQKEQLVIQETQSTIKQQTGNKITNLDYNNQRLKAQYEEQNQQLNQASFKADNNQDLQTNQQETSCQVSTVQIQKKIINKEEEAYMNINFFKKVIIFHQLLGIFYIYDSKKSRAVRFTLFYLKIVHQLTISILFNQFKQVDQQIVVALLNSTSIEIFSFLIQFCYQKSKKGKYFSSLFSAILLLGYYYIILAISSGQTPSESNTFISLFLLSVGLNLTLVQLILSFLMIYVSMRYINNNQTKIITKLYNVFSLEVIIKNIGL
ncbi:hypothetical protein ABPG72_010510 [Tetrahymena utriculariae]